MMATLIALGYALRKMKIVPENTGIALARLETYIFLPALNIITMLSYCNVESFQKSAELIVYGAVIILIAIAVVFIGFFALLIRSAASFKSHSQMVSEILATSAGAIGSYSVSVFPLYKALDFTNEVQEK